MQLKVHYRKIYNDLEAKIKEIRLQIKVALKEKADAQALVSSLQSEISELRIQHADWLKKKAERTKVESIHQEELSGLNGILDSKRLEIDSLNKIQDNRIKEFQVKEKFYLDRRMELEIEIQDKQNKLLDKLGLDQAIAELNLMVQCAKTDLDNLRNDMAVENKAMDLQRELLIVQIHNFEEIVNNTNKRSQQNEIDRGKVEVWIRRLQKYYDDTGINLKILPHFGLTQLDEEKK